MRLPEYDVTPKQLLQLLRPYDKGSYLIWIIFIITAEDLITCLWWEKGVCGFYSLVKILKTAPSKIFFFPKIRAVTLIYIFFLLHLKNILFDEETMEH